MIFAVNFNLLGREYVILSAAEVKQNHTIVCFIVENCIKNEFFYLFKPTTLEKKNAFINVNRKWQLFPWKLFILKHMHTHVRATITLSHGQFCSVRQKRPFKEC